MRSDKYQFVVNISKSALICSGITYSGPIKGKLNQFKWIGLKIIFRKRLEYLKIYDCLKRAGIHEATDCLVSWSFRICRLHRFSVVLHMTLKHLMVRIQPWFFWKYVIPLHRHYLTRLRICWMYSSKKVKAVLDITIYLIWWRGSSFGALGSMKYPLSFITPSSTQNCDGISCLNLCIGHMNIHIRFTCVH